MEVQFTEKLQVRLDQLAVASGRSQGELLEDALAGYLDELIPDDEERMAGEKLESLLMEGIESGEPTEMTTQDWIDIRAEGLKLLETRRRKQD